MTLLSILRAAVPGLLAAAAVVTPALAVPQGSAPPYVAPASKRLTVVGTRFAAPVGVSDGLYPSGTTRTFEQITSRSDVGSVQIRLANFASVPKESDATCSLTVTASLEYDPGLTNGSGFSSTDANAILVPLTFNGARTATVDAPNGVLTSDPFNHNFKAGQGVYVRLWFKAATAGCKIPVGHYINASLSEWTNDGYYVSNACASQPNSPATSWSCSATANVNPAPIFPLRPGSQTLYSSALGINTLDVNQGNGTGAYTFTGGTGTINYTTGALSLTFTASSNAYLAQVRGYGRQTDAPDDTLVANPTDTNQIVSRYVYTPAILIGTYAPYSTVNPFTLCAFGTSIDWGSGNSTDFGISWINYALGGSAGLLKVATPSDTATYFGAATTNFRRLNLVAGLCDRAIADYATNDISSHATASATEAAITASAQAIATVLPHGAADLYWSTVIPRVMSATNNTPINATDFGPATVASGSPSTRNAVNAWEFTQVGTLWAGVIDTAAVLEASPASATGAGNGLWGSLSNTYDGIHPNTVGNQLIGNTVKAGGSAPHPAFAVPAN